MDTNSPAPIPDIHAVLAFYAEAGVDEALNDTPINRFEARPAQPALIEPAQTGQKNMPPSPTAPRLSQPVAQPVAVPDGQQVAFARELAASASTLEELREHLMQFNGCNLKATAKNLVFADGNPQAPIMFIGEAPGRDEDLEGTPFIGRGGQLLDQILAAIELERSQVYMTNVIPWRPPGNREATPQETEICRPFIERQIELVAPKVLVHLGGASAKTLLNTTEGILRLRGNWHLYSGPSGAEIPAMPTLHPAYLLHAPAHKRLAWRDFLEIKMKLRALS